MTTKSTYRAGAGVAALLVFGVVACATPKSGAPAQEAKGTRPKPSLEACKAAHMASGTSSQDVAASVARLTSVCNAVEPLGAATYCGSPLPTAQELVKAVTDCGTAAGAPTVSFDFAYAGPNDPPPTTATGTSCPRVCSVQIRSVEWRGRRFVSVAQEVPSWVPWVGQTNTFEVSGGAATPYFTGSPADCVVQGHGAMRRELTMAYGDQAVMSTSFKADLPQMPFDVVKVICGYDDGDS